MSKNRGYTNYSNMGKSSYAEAPTKEVDSEVVPNEMSADLSQIEDKTAEVSVPVVPVLRKFKLNGVDALNVRVKPGGDVVMVVKTGNNLTEMESSNLDTDWTKVKTDSGVIGFVKSEFITEI